MTRLKSIEKDSLSSDDLKVWDKIAGKRGDVRGPYQVLMHAPALADKVADLGELLRFTATLPGKERELAILTTARTLGVAFEWVMHEPFARREGVSPQTIEVVRSVGSLDALEQRERVIVELARTLVDSRMIPDDLYERARTELGTALLVELVTLVGFYQMIALILTGFEVELPDGAAQPF